LWTEEDSINSAGGVAIRDEFKIESKKRQRWDKLPRLNKKGGDCLSKKVLSPCTIKKRENKVQEKASQREVTLTTGEPKVTRYRLEEITRKKKNRGQGRIDLN